MPLPSTHLPVLGAWCKRMDYGDYTLCKAPMRGGSLLDPLLCPHSVWAEGMPPRRPASCARTRHASLPLHHGYDTVLVCKCRRDPRTGKLLASVFGRRKDEGCLKLEALQDHALPYGCFGDLHAAC